MHIVHYIDQINHLNGRHSTQSSSSSVALGGEMLTLSLWKQRGERRGTTNMRNPTSWCFYQEAQRLMFIIQPKPQQHSEQDLPRGSSLSPDSWVALITGLQGYQRNKAFVMTNSCSQPAFFLVVLSEGTTTHQPSEHREHHSWASFTKRH